MLVLLNWKQHLDWSAVAAVASVASVLVSLASVGASIALLRLTRQTVQSMKSQSEDIRTQAQVATAVLESDAMERQIVKSQRVAEALHDLREIRTRTVEAKQLMDEEPSGRWLRSLPLEKLPQSSTALAVLFPTCVESINRYGTALHHLHTQLRRIDRCTVREDYEEYIPQLTAAFLAVDTLHLQLTNCLKETKIGLAEQIV